MVMLERPDAALADPMVPRPYRVQRVRRETRDVSTLWLEPMEDAGKSSAPGQFNMLYAFGVGEVPISISGESTSPAGIMQTVRGVGPVSIALCRSKRGDVVGVRGPFGHGWPIDEASGRDVVIVAGGIGLAPLRPAVERLLDRRERYGRIALLYGGRTPLDLLYRRELGRWRSRFDLEVEITVDAASVGWRGYVGLVTTLIPRAVFDPSAAIAFVCGPEVMMRFTIAELQDRGVPPESIYISMERNMKCAVGFCGHCQFGPTFICKDGPVFRYDQATPLLRTREI
jgi:NAD(P)H-flavin reductase